ncbi:MAG: hypothetical protein ACOVNS_02635 [Erythrobacter sp.]|jgi:hypothetical protein
MRSAQADGKKGSLKWIQRAVNAHAAELEAPILAALSPARSIEWRSPLLTDDLAEYRDASFLDAVGLGSLSSQLADFWPRRGPQWDALGLTDAGHVLLVEAKAHIGEFCSPASDASPASLAKIHAALASTAKAVGATPEDAERWSGRFYQYTNRLAHLVWLRQHGVEAILVLVGFCHDDEMPGETTPEAWAAAYQVADFALGIPRRNPYSRYIVHVCPSVVSLERGIQ